VNSLKGLGFWLAAWVAGFALWLLLTDTVVGIELIAGAVAASLGATGFELVRRQRITQQAVMPQLVLRAWRVFPRIPADVLRLTRAAVQQTLQREPVRGRVIAMPLGYVGESPEAHTYRAVAAGLGSIAPNSIVIGVDHETGTLIVHQLEPTRKPSDLDALELR
jgi:multisubunit Na+/H+ antiporter MnhE subunit